MAAWIEIARDSRRAAGLCLSRGHYRSCVSRAYYAVFSAVIAALQRTGLQPQPGREAWAHARLHDLVRENLKTKLSAKRVRDLRRIIRENYRARIHADYVSGATTDEQTARRCLTSADSVIRLCEGLL